MSIINKKHKAFTFAELMVILTVLTIVLAALSPVFTAKYINAASDLVWHYATNDKNKNAYSNENNVSALAESFIGITPTEKQINDVQRGKVVIRPSDNLKDIQPQIDLRFQADKNNSGAGTHAGSIVVDNKGNYLFGGPYNYEKKNGGNYPKRNTSFGRHALGTIPKGISKHGLDFYSVREDNTAIGFNALALAANESKDNTVIGFNDIGTNYASTTVVGNTLIGYRTTTNYSNQQSANYNTAIGDYSLNNMLGSYNTAIGTNAAIRLSHNESLKRGLANVAVGYNSLASEKYLASSYNTAIGAYSGYLAEKNHDIKGRNNTYVGYNSGSKIGYNASNKTCIGANSCSEDYGNGQLQSMLGDDEERVFIGRTPLHTEAITGGNLKNGNGGIAVLEVHNVSFTPYNAGFNKSTKGWKNHASLGKEGKLGNSSVIINGNLVVRGQTYMGSPTNTDDQKRGEDSNSTNKDMRIDVSKSSGSYQENPYDYYFGLHGFTYGSVGKKTVPKAFYASNGSDRIYGLGHEQVKGALESKYYRVHHSDLSRKYCVCAPGVSSYDWTTRVAPVKMLSDKQDTMKDGFYSGSEEIFTGRGAKKYGEKYSGGYCDLSFNENGSKCDSMVYIGNYHHRSTNQSLNEAHNRYYDKETLKEYQKKKDKNELTAYDIQLVKDIVFYNSDSVSKIAGRYIEGGRVKIPETFFSLDELRSKDYSYKNLFIDGANAWTLHPSDMSYINTYAKASPQTCGCCPNLLSDSRLKDVGEAYSAGLAELKKLKIYNYIFKDDELKIAHVGVIAQDLKRIFPNAVYKDENGYYKIRWDEMFYAAINAVKELNTRIESLASRVQKDIERVEALKRDNAELAKKLDKLSAELEELEKVKK